MTATAAVITDRVVGNDGARRLRRAAPLRVLVWLVAVSSWIAHAAPAMAQPQPPLRLSLEEARSRAMTASQRLAEARARAAVAQGAVAVRAAEDRPSAALLGGYTRTNHVPIFAVPGPGGRGLQVIYPDVPDNYRTRVDLQWPIYSGGRTDALERAAAAEAAAATYEVAAAQSDLRLEVTRAYWALVTADATVTVVERSLARARSQLADIRQRFDAGLVPPNEIAAGQAQESRQRMLLIEAANQRSVSSSELAYLVGAPVTQRIEPADTLELPAQAAGSLDALVAEARDTRDERRAFERRIEAALQQQLAIEAGRRPTITTAAGFDLARPNPRIFPRAAEWKDSWDAGVAITYPLWDGGRVRAQALQAASAVVAARASLAEFDSTLPLEVQRRLLEIDSGRAAVSAADDAVRAAAEALRVVGERYRAGVIAQGEVRDADVELLQAELDRTRAIAGVRLAEAMLARALGR